MLKNILKNVKRPTIDFKSVRKSSKPNNYLLLPPGFSDAKPDGDSPVFDVSAPKLAEMLEAVLLDLPNTEKLGEHPVGEGDSELQQEYVQYSNLVGFPDTLTVRFMPAGENAATLAIYSRAHYGYRDFGVNAKRVARCIDGIQHKLGT